MLASIGSTLHAEAVVRIFTALPSGQYVHQIADVSTFTGFERSFAHNAPEYGVELEAPLYQFIIGGRYQRTATGRNQQDFHENVFMVSPLYSNRSGRQFDVMKGVFRDQIDMYNGVGNQAASKGEADFKEYQGRLWLLYAVNNNWAFGIQSLYSHNFYTVKNIETIMYGDQNLYYTPVGLTMRSDFVEWQAGFRYNTDSKPFRFQADLFAGTDLIRFRDLRQMVPAMYKSESDGPSLFARLGVAWQWNITEVALSAYARRLFTRGTNLKQTFAPGITVNYDFLAPVDANFRENGIELSFGLKIF